MRNRHRAASAWCMGVLSLGMLSAVTPLALAAPEPEAIPRRWQIRVIAGDLRCMLVDVPGVGPRTYLFMTFKAVNDSGEDLDFAPSFELATNTGQLVRSGRNVPHPAVQEIMRKIDHPLLETELGVQGRFLQGEAHAKEGLVVWEATDMEASEYTVFMSGFSGETKTIVRPDDGSNHMLRKTLMLTHAGTGRLDPSSGRPLQRVSERWILR